MEGVLTNKDKQIKQLLSEGADERIFLDTKGLAKYGISLVNTDIINRGSCTGSPATKEDISRINELLEVNKTENDWIKHQTLKTQQLKELLNETGEDLFEVFYAPSGTDLFYYPIIFGKILNHNKQLINLITCKEELGSGTPFAAEGRFYANYNQFGETITKGDGMVSPNKLETIFFEARSNDGHILNHEEEIKRLVYENPDKFIIANLVYGSKSGISDNIQVIDKIKTDNLMWSIDMCQLRHKKEIVRMFLQKNAMVMITGSKFYQAPPFCAALLVPKNIYNKLLAAGASGNVKNFGKIFSQYDIPEQLRENFQFPPILNISSCIRWDLTINEIEKYYNIPVGQSEEKIDLWNKTMMNEIKKIDEFELMPNQEKTNKSIISFRIKINGSYLNNKQLKNLHRTIVTSDHSSKLGTKGLFIGQPVAYANKSFLRIAIGSKNVRQFVKSDEQDFSTDKVILDIIRDKLYELYEHSA